MVLPILPKDDSRLTNVGFDGFGTKNDASYIPNRGSFYYGVGEFFMGSDQSFATVQNILRKAVHHFHVFNLAEDNTERIMPPNGAGDVIFYVSNVPWFLFHQSPYSAVHVSNMQMRWARPILRGRSEQQARAMYLLTASDDFQSRVIPSATDPHMDVYMRMHAMLDDIALGSERPLATSMVEVIADSLLPRGMTEFPRTVIGHSAYLKLTRCEAGVTVLHILVGEGAIPKKDLSRYFDKAVQSSRFVLVMEHNGGSADFVNRASELFTHSELTDTLASAGSPVAFDYCTGYKDAQRNMLLLYRGKLKPSFPNHYTCAFPY